MNTKPLAALTLALLTASPLVAADDPNPPVQSPVPVDLVIAAVLAVANETKVQVDACLATHADTPCPDPMAAEPLHCLSEMVDRWLGSGIPANPAADIAHCSLDEGVLCFEYDVGSALEFDPDVTNGAASSRGIGGLDFMLHFPPAPPDHWGPDTGKGSYAISWGSRTGYLHC